MNSMDENEAINIHLKLQDYRNSYGLVLESCLTHALREVRIITGRDIVTGEAVYPEPEGSYLGRWSGAMVYFSILDQIGTCYKPKYCELIQGNSIEKALWYFSPLSVEEIRALYALRNAFIHDFSLFNHNRRHPDLQHYFRVDNHPTNAVLILPHVKWDGKLQNRNKANQTYVNLRALGDLVEDVYLRLLACHERYDLEIILKNGYLEILERYIFYHR